MEGCVYAKNADAFRCWRCFCWRRSSLVISSGGNFHCYWSQIPLSAEHEFMWSVRDRSSQGPFQRSGLFLWYNLSIIFKILFMVIAIIGTMAVISQVVRTFPQVIKGFATKSVKDVSLWWEIIASASAALWLVYGILVQDKPLIIGNSISLVAFSLLLYQKARY